jgi:hypothetical protein
MKKNFVSIFVLFALFSVSLAQVSQQCQDTTAFERIRLMFDPLTANSKGIDRYNILLQFYDINGEIVNEYKLSQRNREIVGISPSKYYAAVAKQDTSNYNLLAYSTHILDSIGQHVKTVMLSTYSFCGWLHQLFLTDNMSFVGTGEYGMVYSTMPDWLISVPLFISFYDTAGNNIKRIDVADHVRNSNFGLAGNAFVSLVLPCERIKYRNTYYFVNKKPKLTIYNCENALVLGEFNLSLSDSILYDIDAENSGISLYTTNENDDQIGIKCIERKTGIKIIHWYNYKGKHIRKVNGW